MKRVSLFLTVLTLLALTVLLTSSAAPARSAQQEIKGLDDLNGLKRYHVELPASNKDWMGFATETDKQGNMKVTTFDNPEVMAKALGITVEEVLNKTTPKYLTKVSSPVVEKQATIMLKIPWENLASNPLQANQSMRKNPGKVYK